MYLFLALCFCLNAFISAFVGLGGATYNLLLLQLFGVDFTLIPLIALSSSIAVSGISTGTRLHRKEYQGYGRILILCIFLPAMLTTYIGGQVVFVESAFRIFLDSAILLIVLLRLLQQKAPAGIWAQEEGSMSWRQYALLSLISLGIGLLSGLLGIGGGILLGPILYLLGLSYQKIPALTAAYIFVNSIIGLVSQTQKYLQYYGDLQDLLSGMADFWPLVAIVALASSISLLVSVKFARERLIKNTVLTVLMSLVVYNFAKTIVSIS